MLKCVPSTAVGQEEASNSGRHVGIHGVSLSPDENCGAKTGYSQS